jgi:hypothetical protein
VLYAVDARFERGFDIFGPVDMAHDPEAFPVRDLHKLGQLGQGKAAPVRPPTV